MSAHSHEEPRTVVHQHQIDQASLQEATEVIAGALKGSLGGAILTLLNSRSGTEASPTGRNSAREEEEEEEEEDDDDLLIAGGVPDSELTGVSPLRAARSARRVKKAADAAIQNETAMAATSGAGSASSAAAGGTKLSLMGRVLYGTLLVGSLGLGGFGAKTVRTDEAAQELERIVNSDQPLVVSEDIGPVDEYSLNNQVPPSVQDSATRIPLGCTSVESDARDPDTLCIALSATTNESPTLIGYKPNDDTAAAKAIIEKLGGCSKVRADAITSAKKSEPETADTFASDIPFSAADGFTNVVPEKGGVTCQK